MYSKLVNTLLGRHKSKADLIDIKNTAPQQTTPPSSLGHAPSCDLCGHHNEDCVDMAPNYILKWQVTYLGSFPISTLTAETIHYRLSKFQPSSPRKVTLSASPQGVRVHVREEQLLCHSMRRICSVVARPELREIAYIAYEAAGQTYRRLCHVFTADDKLDIVEIETVLGNAFQSSQLKRQGSGSKPQMTHHLPPPMPMAEKRSSSSAFLSRLMGKGKDTVEDAKAKRKRRPVSAVFSAFQRFSSSTTMSNKRMTSYDPPLNKDRDDASVPVPLAPQPTPYQQPHLPSYQPVQLRVNASPVPEEPIPNKERQQQNRNSKLCESPPSLVWDDKLGEAIYAIDDGIQAQLENVNYFVKLPSRELLARNLLSHPEGAFVVRYSESKRTCLALSIRVPLSHNETGISHYLLIKNEKGYRIRNFSKHFVSLQMLVTHHSVMSEQLPVPLLFVQWNKDDWAEKKTNLYDMPAEYKDPSSCYRNPLSRVPELDENRNTRFFHDEFVTPRRFSKFHEGHTRLVSFD